MNRRDLVKMVGAAGVGVAATLVTYPALATEEKTAPGGVKYPWPYKPLDSEVAAARAYAGYWELECMYGGFESIAAPIAEQLGSPYKDFPFAMMKFGGGGIYGWGTVCGTISGAAAAIQLLSPKPQPLVDALFIWYESEALPDYHPKEAKFPEIRSIATVPLCHASISNWCKASGKKSYSDERKERCAALCGSVARKAVMLLNDQADAKSLLVTLPAATQACSSCHEQGGVLENSRGKMSCGGCHSEMIGKHPQTT
jgi:hypothetical protein